MVLKEKTIFVITVASEVMAILCLSKDLQDFEKRIGRAVVAYTYDDQPVTVNDIQVAGAATVVMKEAINPNLVQTLEHTPTFIMVDHSQTLRMDVTQLSLLRWPLN